MKKILYLVLVAVLAAAVPAWGQNNQTYTLGKIPAGWTVKANGNTVTVTDSTAIIPAGATVTLTPTYPAKVKSVKLKDVPPTGAIKGEFTVNAGGKKVWFSQGNLQAVCSSADNDASTQETWTWQFATNQWDYIGSAAANTSINGSGSVSVAGTVDLFGWVGTSSYNNNYGIWNNTTANSYGNTKNESLKNDWGHNAIANGGNTADMWRTLTREEWGYMLSERSGATVNGSNNVRFAKATIRTDETAVKGVILFPDGATFEDSEASWNDLNSGYNNYTTTCTAAQWTALEAKGCVFLPAAGNRTGTTVSDAGNAGAYWTATGSNQSGYYTWAHMVYFNPNTWSTSSSYKEKSYGLSVRLVKVVPHAVDLSTLTGDYEAQDGDILIGTLAGNYKISIADGATVTLRNATINGTNNDSYKWAGITCLGDATIVLEGTNTVTGFHHWYPGIQAAHNGTGSGDEYTLTIKGDGSLTASSNYSGDFCAAGIGAGYNHACGNILIESGTIVAESVYHGAGIGGATYASCGTITITGGTVTATCGQYGAGIGSGSATTSNPSEFCAAITITGGTVTAIGGEHGAGIGSGYKGKCQSISITGGTVIATGYGDGAGIGSGKDGSCSTITIADGVTQVTATKGSTATNSIGKGAGTASCGTVTIGGTVYYQDNAYVGTGSTYLTQSPLDYPSLLLRGKFTINGNGGKVQFSKGNLKRVNDTWSFFTNQYDCLGDTWNSTSCDLFYWEMTGNYGSAQSCVTSSGTASDVVDWGTNIGTGWKTLTKDEWVYLFNTRTNASSKYGYGIVNEVKGMIILPDSWTLPDGLSFTAGISYFTNNYSTAQWSQMEAAGAVFLPAAGNRDSGGPNNRNIDGYYMSSSPDGVDKAYRVQFYSNYLKVDYSFQRSQGGAVRLVKDAN